ncbi:hypothetical protein BCR42DRAFT_424824 [Absidia repens]|uniref:Uncharacterized protein n=1 Tax=Absidia repens TaxID=90262 RepID=A0A1X2I3A2_9FUNG|nr:hypothetical protein BCR42DRAFT_424824 [Absidia repens]
MKTIVPLFVAGNYLMMIPLSFPPFPCIYAPSSSITIIIPKPFYIIASSHYYHYLTLL